MATTEWTELEVLTDRVERLEGIAEDFLRDEVAMVGGAPQHQEAAFRRQMAANAIATIHARILSLHQRLYNLEHPTPMRASTPKFWTTLWQVIARSRK